MNSLNVFFKKSREAGRPKKILFSNLGQNKYFYQLLFTNNLLSLPLFSSKSFQLSDRKMFCKTYVRNFGHRLKSILVSCCYMLTIKYSTPPLNSVANE